MKNLNEATIHTEGRSTTKNFGNNNIEKENINVYFREIKQNLISHIRKSEYILGCVAWLTDFEIINELSKKQTCIIVQKEDFLRPDYNIHDKYKWKKKLKNHYSKLDFCLTRGDLLPNLSFVTSYEILDAIRCVGNFNRDKLPAFPRMHNKFLVFANVNPKYLEFTRSCKNNEEYYESFDQFRTLDPYAVWTGSFNFTFNAHNSLENAIYLNDEIIAKAYYDEWKEIASISEPLNWNSDWIEPEWRIGS